MNDKLYINEWLKREKKKKMTSISNICLKLQTEVHKGRYIIISVILISCIIAFTLLISDLVIKSYHGGTECRHNFCIFKSISYPMDITCQDTKDCLDWTHPCELNKCIVNGTKNCLYKKAGDFVCECNENYSGKLCENYRSSNESSICDYCMNNGICVQQNDTYTCLCTEKYMGKHCQLLKVSPENWKCMIPKLKESSDIENSTWYAILSSNPPYMPNTACSFYQFTMTNNTLQLSIKEIAMSHFHIGSGVRENSYELKRVNYFYLIENYTHLPTSSSENSIARVWVDTFDIDNIKYLTMWFCNQDELYREQEYKVILANALQDGQIVKVKEHLENVTGYREIKQNLAACTNVRAT